MPGRALRDTNLTQFAPDVLAGLYVPMFMFTGEYDVSFDSTEKLYRVRAPALFRNAMDLGQYPYPFWHDPRKWNDYQAANELNFWVDPSKMRIVTMQFSVRGKPDPRLISAPRTPPLFDGKWMWMDAAGQRASRVPRSSSVCSGAATRFSVNWRAHTGISPWSSGMAPATNAMRRTTTLGRSG